MRLRKISLVIHVDAFGLLLLQKTCRLCVVCEMLIAHDTEVKRVVDRLAPHSAAQPEYLIVRALDTLSDTERNVATARLIRLGEYKGAVGWGYGDFLADVAAKLQRRNTNPRADRSRAGRGV